MFTKEYSDTPAKEKLEVIAYQPGLQDSGDLEAGTKTITATAEASGLGNATYTASLTLPKPTDARLIVKRICARLQVTIDTIPGGDTDLYCRVYVDAQDANHRLFDLDWTSSGAKLFAIDTHSGALATIFDLLKDGASHTFYFFFWKAGTGAGITIGLVRILEGVGTSISGAGTTILQLIFAGVAAIVARGAVGGTGSLDTRLNYPGTGGFGNFVSGTATAITTALVCKDIELSINPTITTDIGVLSMLFIILQTER